MSESEFDDDNKSRCAEDETFAEFIQLIELNSCSALSIRVGSLVWGHSPQGVKDV